MTSISLLFLQNKILNMRLKQLFLTISIFLLLSTITAIPIQALTYIHSSSCSSCSRYGLLIVVVRDSNGNRVSGATVTVKDPDDNYVKSGTTGRYGRFVTVLPRGDYYVVAEKDGLTAESDVFSLGFFKRVVLRFEESCVTVTVVHDSSPVPGVNVNIIDNSGDIVWYGPTGNDGIARIECGVLIANTEYDAFALDQINMWGGTEHFITDNTGFAEVLVEIG